MKKFFIASISLIFFLIVSCEIAQKPAKGFEDEIYVVADSVEYEQIIESLQSVFEVEISTPQPEKLFTLKRINLSQLEGR